MSCCFPVFGLRTHCECTHTYTSALHIVSLSRSSQHKNTTPTHSETSSALSDRGVYAKDEEQGYISSWDENGPGWGATAEDGWCPIVTRPHMSGAFIWTGALHCGFWRDR